MLAFIQKIEKGSFGPESEHADEALSRLPEVSPKLAQEGKDLLGGAGKLPREVSSDRDVLELVGAKPSSS